MQDAVYGGAGAGDDGMRDFKVDSPTIHHHHYPQPTPPPVTPPAQPTPAAKGLSTLAKLAIAGAFPAAAGIGGLVATVLRPESPPPVVAPADPSVIERNRDVRVLTPIVQ